MHKRQKGERHSYLLLIALGTIVLAFMGLSLAITAIGTARFAVAMGYRTEVGYAVGGVFDVAKAVLPIALLMLVARRAFFFFAIIGSAWLGLVTYSGLATHATVSTAIAAIERTGTWKMEGRTNAKAELASVEQRLIALSQPMPPRPSNSVAEALASERVPAGVWRDSRECQSIRESRYFQAACAKFLELRRELAAAEDYERLDARARELRQTLAAVPIVATSDPLPLAFAATIGRLVPLDGNAGVALLLTARYRDHELLRTCSSPGATGRRRAGRPDPMKRLSTSSRSISHGHQGRLPAIVTPPSRSSLTSQHSASLHHP